MGLLREGEGQRGAGVPGRCPDGAREVLAAVEVAEGEIVDAAQHAGGHGVHAADGQVALGVARLATGDEGMGEHDGAGAGMSGRALAHPLEGGAGDGLVAAGQRWFPVGHELGAHTIRFEVGQAEEEHLAVLVLDGDGMLDAGDVGEQVDAGPHESAAEAEPLRGIVVAGGQHHGRARAGEPGEGGIEQLHAGHCGDCTVVHITRDDDHVDLPLRHEVHQPVEEGGLVLVQIDLVQRAPQMPVRGVQDSHAPSLRRTSDSRASGAQL